jgi:chaperonin GroES
MVTCEGPHEGIFVSQRREAYEESPAMPKELIVVGDRVLVDPENEKMRTQSGLYLPQGLAEKEKVQTGRVIKVGPGYIVPHTDIPGEPWQSHHRSEPQYIPLQVKEGDYAIFLRREAVELEYEGKKLLIVPQSGVLALVRDDIVI